MTNFEGQVNFDSKIENRDYPGVIDILATELNQKLNQERSEILLVDVRQPDEFSGELGHIPGAQLIPLATLPEEIEKLPNKRTIVFVCRSGGRSGRACAFALQYGLDDVYNLKGGMIHWNELNFETEN
mgnify:CR=1 FL=1